MHPTLLLNMFLLGCGLPLLWFVIADYDWLYRWPGLPKIVYALLGRPASRVFYGAAALLMVGWAGVRLVNPPPVIEPTFIYNLSKPCDIDLIEVEASTAALKAQAEGKIRDLQTDDTGWISFWVMLEPESPYFEEARLSSLAGPDFSEGFHVNPITLGDVQVGGRKIYFDSNLQSCDNVLFSKTPLSSAQFIMVISDPKRSAVIVPDSDALAVHFFRTGSTSFEQLLP